MWVVVVMACKRELTTQPGVTEEIRRCYTLGALDEDRKVTF